MLTSSMLDSITDDEDTFLTSSNNLAKLFGVKNVANENASSLTYTAPKQPTTKPMDANPSKNQSTLIIFKEVHAFKLIDKTYINLGKCGFAFIGNENVSLYQLLLYKQKNDIICSTKFYKDFKFNEREDYYASFYDNEKTHWTVHFFSETDLNEFSKAIESHGGIVIKITDLKNSAQLTKSIPVIKKATLTKETNTTLSKIKNCKKEDEKIICSVDNDSADSSNSNKAAILTRMAKMGQKLLPNANLSDGTDSDTDKERKLLLPNRKMKRGSSIPINVNAESHMSKSVNYKALPINISAATQAYTLINGQYVPFIPSQFMPLPMNHMSVENAPSPVMYTHANAVQLPSQPSFEQLQMYFSENRTHNSEVRMNILRLTTKMEQVLDKMHSYETERNQAGTSTDDSSEIESLRKENLDLKLFIDNLQQKIEKSKELEQKYIDLLDKQIISKPNDELDKIDNSETEKDLNKIAELESVVNTQAEILNKMESDKENDKIVMHETIKKLMNSLYNDINVQFSDEESVSGRDIKKMLAQKIVDNAFSIIGVVSESSTEQKSDVK